MKGGNFSPCHELEVGQNASREKQICESKVQGRRKEKAKGYKCQTLPDAQVFNGILKINSQEAPGVGLEKSRCEFCLLGR